MYYCQDRQQHYTARICPVYLSICFTGSERGSTVQSVTDWGRPWCKLVIPFKEEPEPPSMAGWGHVSDNSLKRSTNHIHGAGPHTTQRYMMLALSTLANMTWDTVPVTTFCQFCRMLPMIVMLKCSVRCRSPNCLVTYSTFFGY